MTSPIARNRKRTLRTTSPVYLDYASTTPTSDRVLAAMAPYWTAANPSSQHPLGREAAEVVAGSTQTILAALGEPLSSRLVFTGSATEANNLALLGYFQNYSPGTAHALVSATEHASVLSPARQLLRMGYDVSFLPVDRHGQPQNLEQTLDARPDTRLVSIMAANNEIGTTPDLAAIARTCARRGVVLHTDAAQAVGKIPVDLGALPGDLMVSLSGHKIYGPPGIGALVVRPRQRKWTLKPILTGGSQQSRTRSGTLPVALIVGLAAALSDLPATIAAHQTLAAIRNRFESHLLDALNDTTVHGDPVHRLPHLTSIAFGGIAQPERFLEELYSRGVCVGTTSACNLFDPSHVMSAVGIPPALARATIRITISPRTTEAELGHALGTIITAVRRARRSPNPRPPSPMPRQPSQAVLNT